MIEPIHILIIVLDLVVSNRSNIIDQPNIESLGSGSNCFIEQEPIFRQSSSFSNLFS